MNENKNFCTKCECYFTQPGTCNCFAPAQVAPTLPYVPYIPTYPTYPVYPFGTPIWVGPSPTTTVAPMIGNDWGVTISGQPLPGVTVSNGH